jgi:hypothetical protein
MVTHGAVVRLESVTGVQVRQTPSVAVNHPLAVSVARALAAVCAQQRITVYDLQDDDEDQEDGSDAGGTEEEAAAMGAASDSTAEMSC